MRKKRSVLVVQYSSGRDGSAFSGLLLADGFREAGWTTVVAFAHGGPMEGVYREHGHAVRVVPHKNWLRRAHPLRFGKDTAAEMGRARAFRALIDEVGPDVVYINTAVSLAGAVAARLRRRPTVWHLRELFADVGGEMRAPSAAKRYVASTLLHLADRLVTPSRAIAENMLGARADRATVVPNAVADAFFVIPYGRGEARRRLGLAEEGPLLGVPGTLRPMKGHPFFLTSVAPLVQDTPGLSIAVTGGGASAYAAQLRELTTTLEIAHRTTFLGSIDDMAAFYRACDLVCVPSVAEPFGRTVIEAHAAGTPVVATAVGGIRETIEDGVTGLLVPYGDGDALRRALSAVLSDPSLRRRVGAEAHRQALVRYPASRYQHDLVRLAGTLL